MLGSEISILRTEFILLVIIILLFEFIVIGDEFMFLLLTAVSMYAMYGLRTGACYGSDSSLIR